MLEMATFLPRDAVNVKLSEKHELGGQILHAARFVKFLPGREWAEVELEKEHAGGTKRLNVPVEIIAKAEK